MRNVDLAAPVAIASWLPPPSNILVSAGTFSFSAVSGATVHGGEIQNVQGQRVWSITVFAGNDREATQRAREYFVGYRPSSPAIALFRDGEVVKMLERWQIELEARFACWERQLRICDVPLAASSWRSHRLNSLLPRQMTVPAAP